MNVRTAVHSDLKAIETLRRADGDALGFVPLARYEHITNRTSDRGRMRWQYERLLVCEDEGEITGFLLAGYHRNGLKIEQVCVRQDARRMERALRLVGVAEDEAWVRGSKRSRCRVAADLEANYFWTAAGYTVIASVASTFLNHRPSVSGRVLLIYEKALNQLELALWKPNQSVLVCPPAPANARPSSG